jgi:hypothetical protein
MDDFTRSFVLRGITGGDGDVNPAARCRDRVCTYCSFTAGRFLCYMSIGTHLDKK